MINRHKNLKNLIVASRNDAFGSRMLAFISAWYLSKKTRMHFGFIWHPRLKRSPKDTCDLAGVELFSKEFTAKYCYNDILPLKAEFPIFENLESIRNSPTTSFGHYFSWWQPITRSLKNVDMADYRAMCPKIWEEIEFSEKFQQIIDIATKDAIEFGEYDVLHIRCGDCVYTPLATNGIHAVYGKYYPVELLVRIVGTIQTEKLVLISDDDFVLDYIASCYPDKKLYKISEFRKFDEQTCLIIYDIVFASKAKVIYHGASNFLQLSHLIGNTQNVNYTLMLPIKERFELLEGLIDKAFTNNHLKMASYLYLWECGRRIGISESNKISLLEKVAQYTSDELISVFLVLNYLVNNYFDKAEYHLLSIGFLRDKKWKFSKMNYLLEKLENTGSLHLLNLNKNSFPKYPFWFSSLGSATRLFVMQFYCWKLNLKQDGVYDLGVDCDNEILKNHFINSLVLFTNTLNDLLNQEKNSSNIEISNAKFQSILQEKAKLESLTLKQQKRINELDNAKIRIHSHLAYKLGSAMILNSKSLWGYIRMPYVLSYIKESHREEQRKYQEKVAKNPSLKLPKLESYPDYKEAIKEKQCFTYKLGEALIKANNVRGGGRIFAYLRFFQEVRELRKEFREKKK